MEKEPGCMVFQTVSAVEVGSAAEIAQREREYIDREGERERQREREEEPGCMVLVIQPVPAVEVGSEQK